MVGTVSIEDVGVVKCGEGIQSDVEMRRREMQPAGFVRYSETLLASVDTMIFMMR